MFNLERCAKINVKVLLVLILVTVALGTSLFAARHIRRNILSKIDLEAGQTAFENEDWPEARKYLREYLGRNPDDIEILKKFAKAAISIRPLDAADISGALAAYRRVLQLDPLDEEAYEKLAMLYTSIGNFEELAYIARSRIELDPEDFKAPLWLGDALSRLNKMDEAQQTLEEFMLKLEALPDKHVEYVRACLIMSRIAGNSNTPESKTKALEWLNKAVEYDPEFVESLASRARFYRQNSDIPDISMNDMMELARKDLEAADVISIEDPRMRLLLGAEWMYLGEFDRAAAQLKAADSLTKEAIEEYFFDVNDWIVKRFILASELALRSNNTVDCNSLADEVLPVLTEKRHRIQALPSAIKLYIAADNVLEARKHLDEYLDNQYTMAGSAMSKMQLAYLQALVARGEEKPYVVIDVLRAAIVSDVSRPDLWLLLAGAYSRTDQTRLAIGALIKYLRFRPRDPEVTLQLAKEYLKLRDWNRAFETARLAEPLNPTDIIIRLLRIEASIYIAAEQRFTINKERLEALSSELAVLRKDHPDRVDIRILQAIIAVYLEQPDKAERELKLAIEECEETLRAEMQLARHYYRIKRIPEAISTCRTACERLPELAEPWLSLAGLYVAKADYESARSTLRKGLDNATSKLEKRSLSVRLALVELLYLDRATGISLLSEVAAQDEQEIRARSLLLGIREIQEDRATAEKLIGELREAEGESGLFWRLHQAASLLSSDNWRSMQPDIIEALQYCIDIDPEWSAPALLLANMYEKLQDFGRFEDTCRQALIRNPSATDVADVLMTLLEKQGRFSDAEKVLEQIEANPRVTSTWNVRMALSAGNFSRAIEELELRVSNDDRDANSRILLARLIYWQTGDTKQAFAYLKEAEAIMPDSMAFTAARVSILRAEGRTEEAQRILNDYVANNDAFGAYTIRASFLASEGEFELAEKDYKKLTTFTNEGATGYQLLSNFYVRNEKLNQAILTLEEGTNSYPTNLNLKRGLMKILLLRADPEDRQRALDILTSLEEQLPQDPELMKLRAFQILEDSTPQSLVTAKEKLENVIKLEPTAVDAHLVLVQLAMKEGQYERARDSAIRALGSNPENPSLLSARGRAELALDNTQMAAQLAQVALQKDPNNVAARDVVVTAAIKSEDPGLLKISASLAHLALAEDPNNAQAREIIVAVALKTKDQSLLEEARTLIESALGNDPTNEPLLLSRARVLVSMEDPRAAIPEMEVYCQTEEGKGSIPALVTLADLYRLSNDMDQAKQWIEQAEQIDRDNLTVVHARFIWLVAQNRFEELKGISSAYLSAEEQSATNLVAAASILAASDSMELKNEGLKLFEHAVTLSPTLKNARMGLASTLYQTGNAERAVEKYRELLQQYPNDIQVLNDLAWILQEHENRYDEALELANRGLILEPDELHLLDTRGTILANMEDRIDDAMNDYKRLIELALPGTRQKAKALLELGRIYAKLNDLVQARQYLQDALEIDKKISVFTVNERSEIVKILQGSGIQAMN